MTDLERLACAILLFHRGGPWTWDDHAQWRALTGSPLASTRTLCNLAREVLNHAYESDRSRALRQLSPIQPSGTSTETAHPPLLHHHSSTPRTLRAVEPGGKLDC